MSFATLYRISIYVMLFLSTLALSIDAAEMYPLAPMYPLVVAIAAVVALLTVDRNPRLGLPRDLANLLALGSIVPSLLEYWYDNYLLVLAMGHWLVFLQLIKMFLPKTVEDDWFLFLLGLTQVVVGAFQPGERIGVVMVCWAIAALWALRLFHLRQESLRPAAGGGAVAAAEVIRLPAYNPGDPYPGLVDRPFLFSIGRVSLLTLALGVLIFLLMPRWDSPNRNRRNMGGPGSHLTGFSESVRLGQMGEILESDAVVMSIKLYDENDDPIAAAESDMLFRGVTLQQYEEGQWSRIGPDGERFGEDWEPRIPARVIRQEVKLEPTDSEVLFALRPIADARGRGLQINKWDGTLFRGDQRPTGAYLVPFRGTSGVFDYQVISSADPGAEQAGEAVFLSRIDGRLLEVPADIRIALEPLVERLLAGIPRDQPLQRVRALEAYLRDSNEFAYTLVMQQPPPDLDPIVYFLTERKQGHCEYFASALAMLLRVAGIRSRVVNGFKGGDWNDLGEVLIVRQKHAHSWVEALVEDLSATQRSRWVTLDPTPGAARDETVAQLDGGGARFRYLSDYFRYIWVFYVVGFDTQRQSRLIYAPFRELWTRIVDGLGKIRRVVARFVRRALRFPDMASLFSIRGFLVSFFGLLVVVGLLRLMSRLWRRLSGRAGPASRIDADAAAGIAFYRRLAQLLERLHLKRPPAETQLEFARRSSLLLAGRDGLGTELVQLPAEVVDAYYRIRFGGQGLEAGEADTLDRNLDELERRLDDRA